MTIFENRIKEIEPGMAAVMGAPSDENSSYIKGAALAPPLVREALHSGSANLCVENGLDLGTDARWRDVGDLDLSDPGSAFQRVEEAVAGLLSRGARVLTLGGDHAISYPILRAFIEKHRGLNILQLDAHPDLYDEMDGNRLSNACPFARVMEENPDVRLVQAGIRTMNPHQREQAQRFGVEVIEMRDFRPGRPLAFDGPLYLSLDLDALDPAFAPGVSHHEPGGFTTREVLGVIQGLKAPLVGADIVEFNPERDPVGVTAMLAAKLLKEIVAKMLE
ncbi:MAG: agmatinase [Desulfobacterales bacterium]|nr:agmatinase [Desulfobacterales bacterium]